MTDTKDEREAILNESLANQSPRQLYERAIRAERGAEALERELKHAHEVIMTVKGELDADLPDDQRLDKIGWWLDVEPRAALAQQEPDQPAQDGGRVDPYTLEIAARALEGRAAKVREIQAYEFSRRCREGDERGNEWVRVQEELLTQAQRIRNLQPDQPADAGDADDT